jgi:hypothetical protein
MNAENSREPATAGMPTTAETPEKEGLNTTEATATEKKQTTA